MCKVFPREQFMYLLRHMHLFNNLQSTGKDRFEKVRILLNISVKFPKFVVMGATVSVDESMIPFKGKHGLLFMIKSKPHPIGFKLFTLCCPRTGYIYSWWLDNKQNPISNLGKTSGAVRVLIDQVCNNIDPIIEPRSIVGGKTVYTDNWFTSQELLESLAEVNVSLCGTIRRDRIDKNVALLLDESEGESYVNIDSANATVLKMIASTKNGPKSIYFLTSNPYLRREHRSTVNVSRRIATNNPQASNLVLVNGRATVELHKITVSYSYNTSGSDLADMKIHQATSLIKVRKWWPAVMFFLINAILHNSHVLYCKIKNERVNMPFKTFKKLVATALINGQSFVKKTRKTWQ